MATQLFQDFSTDPDTWAKKWAKCNDTDMAHTCFDFYLDESDSRLGQFKRISAIRFGPDAAKELKTALNDPNTDKIKFSLCMGIRDNGNLSHFTFFFRIRTPDGKGGYNSQNIVPNFPTEIQSINGLISVDPLKPGLVFGAHPLPTDTWRRHTTMHRGVSPEVINQFSLSWCWAESEELANLFKSNQPSKSAINDGERLFWELYYEGERDGDESEMFKRSFMQTFQSAANSFNGEVVRGIEYPILDYNKQAIIDELKDAKEPLLNVYLGLNEGGPLLNKNKFSPIIEILSKGALLKYKEIPGTRGPRLTNLNKDSVFCEKRDVQDNSENEIIDKIKNGLFIPSIKRNETGSKETVTEESNTEKPENEEPKTWINDESVLGYISAYRANGEVDVQSYVSMGVDFVYPCPPFCDPPQLFDS